MSVQSDRRPSLRERATAAREAAEQLRDAQRAKDAARDRVRRAMLAEVLLNRLGQFSPNRIEQVTFDVGGLPTVVADGLTFRMLDAYRLGVRVDCAGGCGHFIYEAVESLADVGAVVDTPWRHCSKANGR